VSRSTDTGKKWTSPSAVAKVSGQAFLSEIAVQPDGTLGVTWYDTRNDRPKDGHWTADLFFADSHDRGLTWSEQHVAGPMDIRSAWQDGRGFATGNYFIGDYEALAGLPDGFAALDVLSHPLATLGKSQLFFAHIRTTRPAHRIDLRVAPRRAHLGVLTRFRFRATAGGVGVKNATVRFGGRRARTGTRGRAHLILRLRGRPGQRVARVTHRAFQAGAARVVVTP
jgi:hypothetical protein